jgi:hypothetical protein
MPGLKMEFTATECIRPDILERSLKSFHKNLKNVDFAESTLWINIDPVPKNERWEDVYDIAKQYFKVVNCNTPNKPNFCKAIKWCWSRPQSPIFFHLELDWILRKPINIKHMKQLLRGRIVSINLRAYLRKVRAMCLSPCLLQTKAAQSIASRMNPKYNPERQLRKKSPKEPHGKNLQGEYISVHYPKQKVIFDIGRAWMTKNKIAKSELKTKSSRHNFNRWHDT